MTTQSPPSTIKAWQYTTTKGGLEKNLQLNVSAPLPKPKTNQHLIKIIATALNPVDYKPSEIPGVVQLAITKSNTRYRLRRLRTGTSPIAGGALSEYAIVKNENAVAVPDGVDSIDAATIGVAGLTAYQSIVPRVKAGDKIFINGGSGGTGAFGIQFAKVVGCHVTTTCSTANVEFVKSLGADKVIDYKKESVLEALKASEHKFDHAVDNVGSDEQLIWRSHEFLRPGASLVVVGGDPSFKAIFQGLKRKLWPSFLGGMKGKVEGFWPQQKPEDLRQIAEWMKEGPVKAVIDQRFPFEEAPQAFEKLKTGRARGKIVVDVASEP
ncbi:hypothetical protein G7Y79_00013g035690 [Physcia stellaris]|nr:hypothetical protein G7Y79_00013g035690 [Physcia stellaris]